jgi:hypothetical protein
MRILLIPIGSALAGAALLALATDPQFITPATAQVSTVSKAGVKGDRLDISRKRLCSSTEIDAAVRPNCVQPAAPTKSAPLARSVVVEITPSIGALSWHG